MHYTSVALRQIEGHPSLHKLDALGKIVGPGPRLGTSASSKFPKSHSGPSPSWRPHGTAARPQNRNFHANLTA